MPDPSRTRLPADTVIAFIGAGNMARSLLVGLRQQGVPGAQLRVAAPGAAGRGALARDTGAQATADNAQAAAGADVIVLAVKPQVMAPVCRELAPALTGDPVIVSVAAGIDSAQIEAWLGGGRAVVRAMPNTPSQLGAGATGLFANARCDSRQRALAGALMAAVGSTVWIQDEALMDVVTAVAGSGPAYFFRLIEAMQAAAVARGLAPEAARQLVSQTAFGAARMALESDEPASQLRQRVTSPGGTTAAAMDMLSERRFEDLVDAAVGAAHERGRQLRQQSSGPNAPEQP